MGVMCICDDNFAMWDYCKSCIYGYKGENCDQETYTYEYNNNNNNQYEYNNNNNNPNYNSKNERKEMNYMAIIGISVVAFFFCKLLAIQHLQSVRVITHGVTFRPSPQIYDLL